MVHDPTPNLPRAKGPQFGPLVGDDCIIGPLFLFLYFIISKLLFLLEKIEDRFSSTVFY